MKYLDEYRDPAAVGALINEIRRATTRPWVIMETCGGQTHTLVRYGIVEMLAPLDVVHGPGCPVCVTPLEIVDKAIAIASRPDVTLFSYGDMLRVPGSHSNLLRVQSDGGDVRIAVSPMDAVRLAREMPLRKVVFFGVGFETTAPANAMAVWQAHRKGLSNFSMLVSHVRVPPALRVLLCSPANRVQGLIAPGHVCTVTGCADYEELAREFHVPIVIGGFEPVDLLQAVLMLVRQLESGQAEMQNQYARSARAEGNRSAQEMIKRVFEICDRKWRGIGEIPASGYRLRPEFAAHDAESVFELAEVSASESEDCIAALVLQGRKKPVECPAFGTLCTPEHPLGAPMVSSEGACAAHHQSHLANPGITLVPGAAQPD